MQSVDAISCRTCAGTVADNLVELTSYTEKYPTKMLWDLLYELVNIDPNMDYAEELPQHLCGTCSYKLENAYYFVMHAREVNNNLVANLKCRETQRKLELSDMDCLQEAPMPVCPEEFLDVKIKEETVEPSSYNEFMDEVQYGNTYNNVQSESYKTIDPLIIRSASKNTLYKSELKDESIISDNELDELPLQQRKERKLGINSLFISRVVKKSKENQSDKCGETFISKCNLKMHKCDHLPLSLTTDPKHQLAKPATRKVSESKQVKLLDANVCKPHGCKLIQCMICLKEYSKFSELRKHLQEHPNIDFFDSRQGSLSEIVNFFYPDNKDVNETNIIERICKDLNDGKYANFYSITNQSGYELSLDSSETESDIESEDIMPELKYTCGICNLKYRRKYQILEHQRQKHSWQEAQHVCARCNARFVSLEVLNHHYKSQCKNTQKRFKCHKCPLRFRWKQNLHAHYREHRKHFQNLQCLQCNRRYDNKKSLTIHVRSIHADESKLMHCHWCNRKFYRKDYLLKHLKGHGIKEKDLPLAETYIAATSKANGTKCILCKICNIRFENITDLKGHIMIELKLDVSLHCSYDSLSNYSITNESGYEMHIDDSETDEEEASYSKNKSRYTCELCQVQCSRKFKMFQHQRSMHRFESLPYGCDNCIFKCASRDILEHHRTNQCMNKEKKAVCTKCGYKFMWPENLLLHMRIQHSERNDESAKESTKNATNSEVINESDYSQQTTPSEQLQCPHCDRTYVQKFRLRNHIRDIHIEGDRRKKEAAKRKFLCSLCGKETHTAADLVTHMRRHTGEKPFKCDMCDMAFPRHCDMLSHRRKHTGEKPCHCTVCGKDFARNDKLKRHMLIHSGLKPYKCNFCQKSYRQSKDLKLHMRQHTGETSFECSVCGERFIQSLAFEKHRIMRGHFN